MLEKVSGKIDETIMIICDQIQKEIRNECGLEAEHIVVDITKALAELVAARASAAYEW